MKKRSLWKSVAALGMAAIMTVSVTGCGNNGTVQSGADQMGIGNEGYVYVANYIDLTNKEENSNMSNITVHGNKLYYSIYSWNEETMESSNKFYCKEIGSQEEATELSLQQQEGENIQQFRPVEAGGMVCVVENYSAGIESSEGYMEPETYLRKYDEQGNEVLSQNITPILKENGDSVYVSQMAVDKEGRIYLGNDMGIFLFDAQGNFKGKVDAGSWISAMGCGKDGKVYVTYYGMEEMQLSSVDFDGKALAQTYGNLPDSNNGNLIVGGDKDFLFNDGRRLYAYELASQTYEEVLDWMDSDINGQYVEGIAVLEDGSVAAVINDWSSPEYSIELALLTKTEASQIPERQLITIGTCWTDQTLQNAAVKFNKNNSQYRIKIKEYSAEVGESETAYEDAIKAMNNDLTSADGPDLINLGYVDSIENLAAKGVLEDLGKYLDAGSVVKREEFLPAILDAYTYDGVLTCIPNTFSMMTVMGKSSLVGEEMGWTLEEMLNFVKEHEDAEIFEYASQDSVLAYCLMSNQGAFMNLKTGECNFDSPEFKTVLEFAKMFPAEYNYMSDGKSTVAKLAENELLLNMTGVYSVQDFVTNLDMFGGEEVTCIGYPTVDGSASCILNAYDAAFGMNSKSKNKEGAWAFIESILSEDVTEDHYSFGLSTRTELLEKTFAEEMDIEYILDENGEPVLDENGEPMVQIYSSMMFEDGTELVYGGATQEQIDQLKALIEIAKPGSSSEGQIMSIITEEAAPYFEGQKSVDEVCSIIQNRIKLYINENS